VEKVEPTSPQELQAYSFPAELYAPPLNGSGEPDYFAGPKPRRNGATRDSSRGITPGTPIAELPGDSGAPDMYHTFLEDEPLQPERRGGESKSTFTYEDWSLPEFPGKGCVVEPMRGSLFENLDLYRPPSPPHHSKAPLSIDTGFASKTIHCVQPESGAWSEEYEEWQDAEEWHDAEP
jgi:hypothetical protein